MATPRHPPNAPESDKRTYTRGITSSRANDATPLAPFVGQEDFQSFGELLRYLRVTYGERTGQNRPGAPKITLTALSLIDCLTDCGYPSMTSGSYSLLESGKTLPKDPEIFLDAISQCLAIGPADKYRVLLRQQYAYDLLARHAGPELAAAMVPRGAEALRLASSHADPRQ
ncbi:MAG: hypothetical protein OJF49_001795 [Ktedonobacterales bacterium]|nr:MAG: hypothetical protein OJF49_001795 [Ktedonobacterales bacterium]